MHRPPVRAGDFRQGWSMNSPHDLAIDDLITTAELNRLGLDLHAVRALCLEGSLRRQIRGWYAVRSPLADRPPWEGEDRFKTDALRHSLRARALIRSLEGRAAASHQTAVVLFAGRLWLSDLSTIHLERTGDTHSRHRRDAVIHPCTAHEYRSVTEGFALPDGYLVVPPAIAAVQVGLRPARPGGAPEPIEALIAAEGFLNEDVISHEELAAAVDLFRGVPGIAAVRRLLADAGSGSESAGETRTALALRQLGYSFTQQVEIVDGAQTYRVDALLDDGPVVVEFDGRSKYLKGISSPTEADINRAMAKEKDRHDRLVRMGYGVARLTWDVVGNLGTVRQEVEAARQRARRIAS